MKLISFALGISGALLTVTSERPPWAKSGDFSMSAHSHKCGLGEGLFGSLRSSVSTDL